MGTYTQMFLLGVTQLFFSRKKYQTLMLSIDFKQLNKVIVKNKYTFPRIDYLFDQLKVAKTLSKIELRLDYHQVRIREEDTTKQPLGNCMDTMNLWWCLLGWQMHQLHLCV
jgi:hypothetical protein